MGFDERRQNSGNARKHKGSRVNTGFARLLFSDLKSAGPKGLWGFDSPSRHQ